MKRALPLELLFKIIALTIVVGTAILLLTIIIIAAPKSDNLLTEADSLPSFLILTILFLSIATVVSVSISFYLYRWRKILLANNNLIVPEEWGKYLISVGDKLQDLSVNLSENMKLAVSESRGNAERFSH